MVAFQDPAIEMLSVEDGQRALPDLIRLLQDVVESGASVGFLPPLGDEEADAYWNAVLIDIASGNRVLLVARRVGEIVGAVQLELMTKPNARHRGEVQKLFVLQSQRRRGIAQRLMLALEQVAHEYKRSLLVLDTRQGDVAESLYLKLGYTAAGSIPFYARNAVGELDATVFYYKYFAEE
jgi:ribosomal protein S18 acetylase RimI-like enzyme